ncbi:hypothetical protein GRF29_8g2421930 [Pseudopithomyces chartarum]|uniref:phosphogluconate dehydrogenase (NADP(+)-dependent, decarboxylating) n=1 Tax=Pseudopithomyces chartarum TaxID=1892770 RepID=A0AAN6M7T2_9PLEO|nr:hypothetical protein GRF29_8g2421930 [Pseudopithomyces chartarum]
MGNANWNFDRDEMEDVEAVKSASNIAGTLRCACTVAPGCYANPDLDNLLFDDVFAKAIHKAQLGCIVSKGALWSIPTPAFGTALSFYDGYRANDLPANLFQA